MARNTQGIMVNRNVLKRRAQKIKAIRSAAKGAISISSIMAETNMKIDSLRHYASLGKIKLPRMYLGMSSAQRVEAVNKALAERENSLEKLCEIAHLSPYGFEELCKKSDIKLPQDLIPYRFRPKMDGVIDRGGTLKEIGAAEGVQHPMAWEYLKDSHQVEYWKNKVEEIKQVSRTEVQQHKQQHKEKLEIMVKFLHAFIPQLYQRESWAVQQALQYVDSLKHRKKSPYDYSTPKNRFSKLVKVLQRYEKAKKSGKKTSLEKLGRGLVPYASEVQRILQRLKLEPPSGARHSYTQQEEYAMQRSSNSKIPPTDIGYLLDASRSAIRMRRSNMRRKPEVRNFIAMGKGHKTLTYRLASQIYEAYAVGIRRYSDIAELLGTSTEIVKYAMDDKKKIAPPIIQLLRNRYGHKYDKPYKK